MAGAAPVLHRLPRFTPQVGGHLRGRYGKELTAKVTRRVARVKRGDAVLDEPAMRRTGVVAGVSVVVAAALGAGMWLGAPTRPAGAHRADVARAAAARWLVRHGATDVLGDEAVAGDATVDAAGDEEPRFVVCAPDCPPFDRDGWRLARQWPIGDDDAVAIWQRDAAEPPPGVRLDALPQGALPPAETRWGELYGGRVQLDAVAGGPLVGEAWFAPKRPGPADLEVEVELRTLRDTDRPSFVATHSPTDGAWPPDRWTIGGVVRDRFELLLPEDLPPGTYSVGWRLRDARAKKPPAAVVLGYVTVARKRRGAALVPPDPAREALTPSPRPAPPPRPGPVLAVGGDAQLGRRQNAITMAHGPAAAFAKLPGLRAADLAYVNLESVLASGGTPADKGEPAPYYYRGRPENVAILVEGGVDVAQGANNHAGDYGPDAMAEQIALLDAAGIARPGIGRDLDDACAPTYRRAGELVVAFVGIADQHRASVAGPDRPGICFVDGHAPDAWSAVLAPRIEAARRRADLVFVGVHWGPNAVDRPKDELVTLGRRMIDLGADGVLGHSAHVLQGVEVYRGRPILHDVGNILFDSNNATDVSGLFELVLSAHGVTQVRMVPVDLGYGESRVAEGALAQHALARVRDLSAGFGTDVFVRDGVAIVDLPPPPERPPPARDVGPNPPLVAPPPPTEPPAGCVVAAVPDDARRDPVNVGPFRLVGARVSPAAQKPRRMVWVETYWTVSRPLDRDANIDVRFVPRAPDGKTWAAGHQGCDWAWPTARWQPGAIYVDRYGVRPSTGDPGTYDAVVNLAVGRELLGEDVTIGSIEVR